MSETKDDRVFPDSEMRRSAGAVLVGLREKYPNADIRQVSSFECASVEEGYERHYEIIVGGRYFCSVLTLQHVVDMVEAIMAKASRKKVSNDN